LQPPIPQVVELTGSESPSTFGWNSKNQRVRHDLSRARIRAIENSLENGHSWVPPSPAHRKTWEEEVRVLVCFVFAQPIRNASSHSYIRRLNAGFSRAGTH